MKQRLQFELPRKTGGFCGQHKYKSELGRPTYFLWTREQILTLTKTRTQDSRNHLTRSLRPSHAVFTIACCLLYIWVSSNIQPKFIIKVNTDPSIYELTRLVREQQKMIEYLSKNPKIIFRCADDEPKIKYPKHASDDLTTIAMGTSDECESASTYDAVIIVHTAADHFDRRGRFRRAYSNFNNTSPYRLKVVFLIGQASDAELQLKLELENMEYGDTLIGAFLDTYHNLTLKAVMGYRWLDTACKGAKLIIKMDDDVFLDVRKFFNTYWNKVSQGVKSNSIHCHVWEHAVVGRTGKWKVEKGLFPNASYPFPYCAGYFVLITPDLVGKMYKFGKSIDFFWIDDVFLYGMVPAAIRNVHFNQLGRKKHLITESYMEHASCVKKKGNDGCSFWGILTDGRDQFDAEYSRVLEPKSVTANNSTPAKKPADKANVVVKGIGQNEQKPPAAVAEKKKTK